MDANSTSPQYDAHSSSQNQASRRSIFWALVTIATSAMLQPSFTGYAVGDNVFEGSIWPHRSSPIVCLCDAAADVWLLVNRRKRNTEDGTEESEEEIKLASSTTVGMRLALVILAALPQAIKLFSMQGILLTQLLAIPYCIALLVGTIRALHLEEPHKATAQLAEKFEKAEPSSYVTIIVILLLSLLAGHVVAGFFVWRSICDNVSFSLSENVLNIGGKVSNGIVYLFYGWVGWQVTLIILWGPKSWYEDKHILPRIPLLSFQLFSPLVNLRFLFKDRETRERELSGVRTVLAYSVLVCMAVCSLTIACLIEWFSRKWLAFSTHLPADDRPPEPSASHGSTTDPEAQRPHAHADTGAITEQGDAYTEQRLPGTEAMSTPTVIADSTSSSEQLSALNISAQRVQAMPERNAESLPTTERGGTSSEKDTQSGNSRILDSKLWKGFQVIAKEVVEAPSIVAQGFTSDCQRFDWLPKESSTVWVAFSILMFCSTLFYYQIAFDPTETYCPSWTSILG